MPWKMQNPATENHIFASENRGPYVMCSFYSQSQFYLGTGLDPRYR